MSIFTSLWFWVLILGILLTIGGIIAWAVTGNADVLVGILLGAGVGWIIGGLLIWIFGRQKKPEVPTVPPMPPGSLGAPNTFPSTMSASYPSATMTANPSLTTGYPSMMSNNTIPQQGTSQTISTNPSLLTTSNSGSSLSTSQQQLMQLLQSNPQLLNSYSGSSPKF